MRERQPSAAPAEAAGFPVASGVLLWTVFAIIAVALRGLRWDENYEYAQVILGVIPYPAGHPVLQSIKGVYSLQTYLAAALLWLSPGPLLTLGVRNVLSLLATVLPPFLATVALTRRQLWGHAAACLALLGVHVLFVSTYPINTWPLEYSNGHVGTGYAVAALALLVMGYRRTFFFMAGLMVSVHLGQLPPVLALAVAYVALSAWQGRRDVLRTAGVWGLAGLVPSALLWLITRADLVPPPTSGPYFSPISAALVWEKYLTYHASHRMLPVLTGHFALAGFLILAGGNAWLEHRSGTSRGPWSWFLLYGAICAAAVWVVMALQWSLGAHVPFVLIGWMPYRLMNHVTTLLVPVVIAVLASRGGRAGSALAVVAGLAVALVLLVAQGPLRQVDALIAPMFGVRYGEAIVFGLYGAAAAVTAFRLVGERWAFTSWLAILAGATVAVAMTHSACLIRTVGEPFAAEWARSYPPLLAATCLTAGFVLGVLVEGRRLPVSGSWLVAPLCLALLGVLSAQQWSKRQNLPVTDFERRAASYLAARGEADAMILVPHQQQSLQARLGHPVMTDMGQFNWIPYKPSIGPSQYKMYKDLYGIDFAPPDAAHAYPGPHWEAYPERHVWPLKSLEDWQRLGREYGFHYVLAPAFIPLQLPEVVSGERERLYLIPEPAGGDSPAPS